MQPGLPLAIITIDLKLYLAFLCALLVNKVLPHFISEVEKCIVCCSAPSPVLNCEICDLFKLWVNHSLVACPANLFLYILFDPLSPLRAFTKNIYIWIFWKVFWGASFSLVFLFDLWTQCWDSITTWNSRLWKQNKKPKELFLRAARGAVTAGCPFQTDASCPQPSLFVLPPLCSSRRKLILAISAHALNRKQ